MRALPTTELLCENHPRGVLDILGQLLFGSITKKRALPAIQVIIPATDDSPFGMGQLFDMRKSATHLSVVVAKNCAMCQHPSVSVRVPGPPWPS